MLSADASSLRKLGTALRKSKPKIHRQMGKELLAVGELVAVEARDKASWSTRIPHTITVRRRGLNTVEVRASAPHAAAYEHAGREGQFRHPVYGRGDEARDQWTWVSEDARPFLHPAAFEHLEEHAVAIADALTALVDREMGR